MSPKSLSMKAFSLGEGAGSLVSSWKQEWENLIEKENCLKLLKDHVQEVNFIPQQPSIAIAKQYLPELGSLTANEIGLNSIEIAEHSDVVSDCSSTLDLGHLTLCCNAHPRNVLHVACAMLQEKGTKRTVISECLEDITHHGNDDETVLEVVDKYVALKPNYPSYQIVGDNLDLDVKVRHMDSDNKNKSFHWFNLVAFKDKITGSHLPDVHNNTLDDVPVSAFLPSEADIQNLRQDFSALWSRVIVRNFKAFAFLQNAVIYHIPHVYSKLMSEPVEEVRE